MRKRRRRRNKGVTLARDAWEEQEGVCVYYCSTYDKAVREGGGVGWRTCATRDYEPRPV